MTKTDYKKAEKNYLGEKIFNPKLIFPPASLWIQLILIIVITIVPGLLLINMNNSWIYFNVTQVNRVFYIWGPIWIILLPFPFLVWEVRRKVSWFDYPMSVTLVITLIPTILGCILCFILFSDIQVFRDKYFILRHFLLFYAVLVYAISLELKKIPYVNLKLKHIILALFIIFIAFIYWFVSDAGAFGDFRHMPVGIEGLLYGFPDLCWGILLILLVWRWWKTIVEVDKRRKVNQGVPENLD